MKPDEQVKNLIECNCGEIYKSRGLTAPDCPQCNYAEDVIELMKSHAKEFGKFIFTKNAKAISGGLKEIQKLPESINEWYDEFINQQS